MKAGLGVGFVHIITAQPAQLPASEGGTAMRLAFTGAVVALATISPLPMSSANAEMFAAKSNWGCLANEGGAAVLRPCSASRHNLQIRYIPAENVFYGPLRLNNQCLDIRGSSVVFSGCNGGTSQTWKFSGTGQLNNSFSCVVGSGNNLVVRPCPAAGAWVNASYRVVQVPGTETLPRGTPLMIRNGSIYNANTNQMVAAGAGNMVAAGAGNMVAAGAGNMVAAGAGNVVSSGGSGMVAAGGGNIVIGPNAAQLVAAGAGG